MSLLKVRADSAETKLKEMDTGLQFANAEVEDLKTQSRKEILISKGLVVLSFREFIASDGKKRRLAPHHRAFP